MDKKERLKGIQHALFAADIAMETVETEIVAAGDIVRLQKLRVVRDRLAELMGEFRSIAER